MAPKYKYGPIEKSGKRKRYQRVPKKMVTYMAQLPCQNQDCPSHGTPHPNCQCYGEFSSGGEVIRFCSETRPHKPGCQYFAGGGKVAQSTVKRVPSQGTPSVNDYINSTIAGQVAAGQPKGLPVYGSPQAPIVDESLGKFDPDDFIEKHGGGAKTGGFDPDEFIDKYEGTNEKPVKGMPETTHILSKGFDPDKFINKYEGTSDVESSIIEPIKAGAEAFSQGLIGDLAKVVQVKSGISTLEDIAKREVDYPDLHTAMKVAGTATSFLPGGPAGKLTTMAGSKILGHMITGMALEASDNVAKSMLGLPGGDTNTAVASTIINGGINGLMNAAIGGLFSKAGRTYRDLPRLSEKAMVELANKPVSKALNVATGVSALDAVLTGSFPAFMATKGSIMAGWAAFQKKLTPEVRRILSKIVPTADEYVGDAMINAMSKTNFFGVPSAVQYAQGVSQGLKKVVPPIEALFKAGAMEYASPVKDDIRNEIRKWVEKGGIIGEYQDYLFGGGGSHEIFMRDRNVPRKPVFAEGGEVLGATANPEAPVDHFSSLYPVENIMLNEVRGRVSNYLNGIRPLPNEAKAPFDSKLPEKEKDRSYKEAIDIAANPLVVLDSVNRGTLTPEKVTHLKSMYPEVHEFLSNKINERIVQAQLNGEKPPYEKRQAMSLFLGADLDSTFSPQSIMAVQAMYASKKQQQPTQAPQRQTSAGPSLTKLSNQYQTDEQAREKRMQNQK